MNEEHAYPWIIEEINRERFGKNAKRPYHLHIPLEGPPEPQEGDKDEPTVYQDPEIVEIFPHGDSV